jgi:hypothetical protein
MAAVGAHRNNGDTPMTIDNREIPTLADDLLRGAEQIAVFIGVDKKRVYYMADPTRRARYGNPPIAHDGRELVASKRGLTEWYDRRLREPELAAPAPQTSARRGRYPRNAAE